MCIVDQDDGAPLFSVSHPSEDTFGISTFSLTAMPSYPRLHKLRPSKIHGILAAKQSGLLKIVHLCAQRGTKSMERTQGVEISSEFGRGKSEQEGTGGTSEGDDFRGASVRKGYSVPADR